jgi:hypothetical protein
VASLTPITQLITYVPVHRLLRVDKALKGVLIVHIRLH